MQAGKPGEKNYTINIFAASHSKQVNKNEMNKTYRSHGRNNQSKFLLQNLMGRESNVDERIIRKHILKHQEFLK
jgi:DNA-binding transcriptional regulator YbjK